MSSIADMVEAHRYLRIALDFCILRGFLSARDY